MFALLSGCASAPGNDSGPEGANVNYEGLAPVGSRAFDVAYVRPGVDFRSYDRVRLGTPELAYRSPDRSARQFPLTDEQKYRFRENLTTAFASEFAKLSVLELVDDSGPATLTVDIRVEDIVVTVAAEAVGRIGGATAVLEASGDALIIVELRDSESNEILARGVDGSTARGGAIRTTDGEIRSRFESADKVVKRWAADTRKGLEALLNSPR